MFIVNVWDEQGIHTIECGTLEDALGKASEFMSAGKLNVSILDQDQKTYAEADIDLLLDMMKAEQKANAPEASPKSDQED